MRTRSSLNLPGESSPNPTSLNPKRRNRRRSKQPFILEESPVDTMADQRTMAKLLCVPTEGYAEAIVAPPILAEHFELKHSLIHMITLDQFFGLENDNPHDHIRPLPRNIIASPKAELKAITTRSGNVLDGPFVPMPPPFINPEEEDERVKETLTDPKLSEFTIKVPPPLKMLKALLSNKEKLLELENTPLNENCLAVILKKLPKKLGDPEKFLIPCGFSELNCKALAELAGIAKDVFVPVGKFTFPADFFFVEYESDPRVPLILGRPFLWTTRALIDVHGEEMILRDGDERLTLNIRHDTSSYSNQPHKESINMITIFNDSCEDYLEDLFATNHLSGNPTFSSHPDLTSPEVKDDIFNPKGDIVLIEKLISLDSTKDLPPPKVINPLSGSTTSSSSIDHLLEEFTNELALITFPSGNDDLSFDIESDLKEIKYFLNHDPTKEMDSILKDSVDEDNLAEPNDNLFNTIPEMFTDEDTLDYSSPPLYDEYDDDLDEFESDTDDAYNDPSDSKGEKNQRV
uniref:Reverse transcriptase domain-containing protein n=1 Tax=Tanacetum cinerariifolium TaxID=118510 RepID=A0A699GKG1_TANCI|nr:hypothetical protein [Tanacetum cinerariifolium]